MKNDIGIIYRINPLIITFNKTHSFNKITLKKELFYANKDSSLDSIHFNSVANSACRIFAKLVAKKAKYVK